jgi:hypothetical protein
VPGRRSNRKPPSVLPRPSWDEFPHSRRSARAKTLASRENPVVQKPARSLSADYRIAIRAGAPIVESESAAPKLRRPPAFLVHGCSVGKAITSTPRQLAPALGAFRPRPDDRSASRTRDLADQSIARTCSPRQAGRYPGGTQTLAERQEEVFLALRRTGRATDWRATQAGWSAPGRRSALDVPIGVREMGAGGSRCGASGLLQERSSVPPLGWPGWWKSLTRPVGGRRG